MVGTQSASTSASCSSQARAQRLQPVDPLEGVDGGELEAGFEDGAGGRMQRVCGASASRAPTAATRSASHAPS